MWFDVAELAAAVGAATTTDHACIARVKQIVSGAMPDAVSHALQMRFVDTEFVNSLTDIERHMFVKQTLDLEAARALLCAWVGMFLFAKRTIQARCTLGRLFQLPTQKIPLKHVRSIVDRNDELTQAALRDHAHAYPLYLQSVLGGTEFDRSKIIAGELLLNANSGTHTPTETCMFVLNAIIECAQQDANWRQNYTTDRYREYEGEPYNGLSGLDAETIEVMQAAVDKACPRILRLPPVIV